MVVVGTKQFSGFLIQIPPTASQIVQSLKQKSSNQSHQLHPYCEHDTQSFFCKQSRRGTVVVVGVGVVVVVVKIVVEVVIVIVGYGVVVVGVVTVGVSGGVGGVGSVVVVNVVVGTPGQ